MFHLLVLKKYPEVLEHSLKTPLTLLSLYNMNIVKPYSSKRRARVRRRIDFY